MIFFSFFFLFQEALEIDAAKDEIFRYLCHFFPRYFQRRLPIQENKDLWVSREGDSCLINTELLEIIPKIATKRRLSHYTSALHLKTSIWGLRWIQQYIDKDTSYCEGISGLTPNLSWQYDTGKLCQLPFPSQESL